MSSTQWHTSKHFLTILGYSQKLWPDMLNLLCHDDKVWMEEGSMCGFFLFSKLISREMSFSINEKNYLNTWAVYDIHPLPDPCSVLQLDCDDWHIYSFSVIKRKERINWLIQQDFKYCFLHIYLEAPGISTIIYALAGSNMSASDY